MSDYWNDNNIIIQDNRITNQPIFVVEECDRIPTDWEYSDNYEWIDVENSEYPVSEHKAKRLDILYEHGRGTGPYEKFYYIEVWKFVTACFTEQGCKDYLKLNGHNLGRTRIYCYSSYRNNEFQTIRNHLMTFADKLK